MDGKVVFRDDEGNIIIEGFFVKGQKEGKETINCFPFVEIIRKDALLLILRQKENLV